MIYYNVILIKIDKIRTFDISTANELKTKAF